MGAKISLSQRSIDRERVKVAASNGQLEVVKQLSNKYCYDVKLLSETLIESCYEGHLHVVKWMVEHTAADVNYTGMIRVRYTWGEEVDDYCTPLTAAYNYKHLDVVKYLVKTSRIDVNLPDSKWGYTPLIRACGRDSVQEAMYLLSEVRDLDINIANRDGNTALHFAVSSSKASGYTQLHKACMKDDEDEVARIVSNNGRIINIQDNSGFTPLHYACYFGHYDIVKTLMMAGADETITDVVRRTPAQVAKEKGHRELLKFLNKDTLMKAMKLVKLNREYVKNEKLTKTTDPHTCHIIPSYD